MKATIPIIIFGTGRSGTTIFHRMLSEHPQISWLSSLCHKYPNKPHINKILMRLLDISPLENILRKKFRPGEYYNFWEHYSKGFSTPCRDLLSDDVSVKVKNNIVEAMSSLTTEKRNRLLIKITGWPRIGFLSKVFDNARFIHVIRDGRAVANSLINVWFWRGWGGPEKWRWGPLNTTYLNEWKAYNKSFIVLAAIQWKILMDAAEIAKKQLNGKLFQEVKYEELCSNPISLFKDVLKFCNLEWSDYFENKLKKYNLISTNSKYFEELTNQQKNDLDNVLDVHLKKYGYI